MIRVVLIEDQRRTREGLVALIDGCPGKQVTGPYGSGEEGLERITPGAVDVVLTDLGLPGMSGIELVEHLSELLPGIPILILTVHGEDQYVFDALCKGACGYLLKDVEPSRLLNAIRELHQGGAPMSPQVARRVVQMFKNFSAPRVDADGISRRGMQVLQLLADGHSYKTCANELGVSLDTIRFHVRHIYERLHVHSKSEAIVKGIKSGWLR